MQKQFKVFLKRNADNNQDKGIPWKYYRDKNLSFHRFFHVQWLWANPTQNMNWMDISPLKSLNSILAMI